jgi:DeoR family transcriptional regulator, suf operon transcriptional repressor
MTGSIGSRQRQILELLLEKKEGLSIDEVAGLLKISRNAVQQHMTALELDGYLKMGVLNKTMGRPVRSYVLTEKGINSFPKQYAWFSELMLTDLKNEMGPKAFLDFLHKLGNKLSQKYLYRFTGKNIDERLAELQKIMDGLGFKTKSETGPGSDERTIEACNCIYHDLAQKHEEICEFDRTLISSLLDNDIEHVECMAKGGAVCRFKLINIEQKETVN